MMGNNPDPMCVFTYVQSLCHSLSKIEKERKDKEKEEKEKAGKNGKEKMKGDDTTGEVSAEEEGADNGTTDSNVDKEGDTETEGTDEGKDALKSCDMEEGGAELVEAKSQENTDS